MARVQAETVGRLQTMGEGLAARQSDLARLVNERLDAVSGRIGQSMEATTQQTVERLQHLHERLALIDNAQKNLNELSSQVTSLRDVLSNKQVRGAFGQARMEAIVQDGLPKGSFQFQFTLVQQHPTGLRDLHAGAAAAGYRRQVPARGGDGASRRQDR